jgi:N-acetyl sugar amidotransferase
MDTTDPDIVFDGEGQCDHCTGLLEIMGATDYREKYNEATLQKLVAKMKRDGRGKEYDCVLGLSGGVDSSYAAYLLKEFGLRTLLVHMDNGWNAEEAVLNMKNIADLLGFDYESYVLDWEEFKDIQLAFLKASVVEADTPTDIAILSALHQVAAKYSVKYIISGGNLATEGILPRRWHYNAKDMRYLKSVQRQFGTRRLRKFPFFGFAKECWYKFFKGIRMVYLLNYVHFSKAEAKEVLEEKLNWRYYGGKHYESRYTRFIQSYLLPLKFNLDYRKATLSSQICAGEIGREAALAQLNQPINEGEIEKEKNFVAKKLGISRQELEDIIQLPSKSYRDYPNNEGKLEFLYRLYRNYFSGLKLSWKPVAMIKMLETVGG